MPPSLAALTIRRAVTSAAARRDVLRVGLIGVFHLAALAIMAWSEYAPEQKLAFLLTWGLLNFFWLALTRRPGVSAVLSLALILLLILLSLLKYKVLWMTLDFIDLMVIDPDSIAFLFAIFPNLGWMSVVAFGLLAPLLV